MLTFLQRPVHQSPHSQMRDAHTSACLKGSTNWHNSLWPWIWLASVRPRPIDCVCRVPSPPGAMANLLPHPRPLQIRCHVRPLEAISIYRNLCLLADAAAMQVALLCLHLLAAVTARRRLKRAAGVSTGIAKAAASALLTASSLAIPLPLSMPPLVAA